MTRTRSTALLSVLCAGLLLSRPAPADFNDGVVALMQGDHETALSHLVPLAETADHAYAQYFLARMYENGQGVSRDPETAAEWYRKAAEQGVGDAQFRLGRLYERGEGLPTDLEYAYGWYSVAAHVGSTNGDKAAEAAALKLSDRELVEAKKLARDLIRRFGTVPRSTSRMK